LVKAFTLSTCVGMIVATNFLQAVSSSGGHNTKAGSIPSNCAKRSRMRLMATRLGLGRRVRGSTEGLIDFDRWDRQVAVQEVELRCIAEFADTVKNLPHLAE
jgi:hypothetical protein